MAQLHLWIWLLCLQTWSEAAGRDADSMVVNGILGESVTFPLNISKSQNISNVAWASESPVAHVEPGPKLIITNAIYKRRIDISENYSLIIKDLRIQDAGTYKANINEDEKTITKIYHLHIYRRLEKPRITQSLMPSLNNTCNVTLTCSVGKEDNNVIYSWSPSGEESNVLQILHSPMDQKLTYTCTAKNPVSNNSDSVTVQQPCTDTPSFYSHHAVWSRRLALISLFLLIPVLALLFYLFKRKRDGIALEADDVSKNTLYSVVSRNAYHTESRIYDEIPQSKMLPCKEESMTTIYSSVQLSEKMGKTIVKNERLPKTLGNEIVV